MKNSTKKPDTNALHGIFIIIPVEKSATSPLPGVRFVADTCISAVPVVE